MGKLLHKWKAPRWLGGAAAPPITIRRGGFAAPRTAIFAKQSLPCESKNHFLAVFAPGEGWTFLGFCCKKDAVDIAKASVDKLKGKMRRKMRALMRWQKRNGLSGDRAARAFIRVFNKKLLESPDDNELSWAKWYFPTINTDQSLHLIDSYAQECLRYLISGTRSKARFNVRYEDLKALGYRSLVHEYYAGRKLKEQ